MKNFIFTITLLAVTSLASHSFAGNVSIHAEISPERVNNLDLSPNSGIETFSDSDDCTLTTLGDGRLQFSSRVSFKVKTADGSSKLYDFNVRALTSKIPNPFSEAYAGWDNILVINLIDEDGGYDVLSPSDNLDRLEDIMCDSFAINVATYPDDGLFVIASTLALELEGSEYDSSNGTTEYFQSISGITIQAHNATNGSRLWKKGTVTGGNWLIDPFLSGVGDYLPATGLEYRLADESETSERSTYRYKYYNLETGDFISSHVVTN